MDEEAIRRSTGQRGPRGRNWAPTTLRQDSSYFINAVTNSGRKEAAKPTRRVAD